MEFPCQSPGERRSLAVGAASNSCVHPKRYSPSWRSRPHSRVVGTVLTPCLVVPCDPSCIPPGGASSTLDAEKHVTLPSRQRERILEPRFWEPATLQRRIFAPARAPTDARPSCFGDQARMNAFSALGCGQPRLRSNSAAHCRVWQANVRRSKAAPRKDGASLVILTRGPSADLG